MLRECVRAKREKLVLNGATMIPSVMTTFGTLGPSAESYLQSLADVEQLGYVGGHCVSWCIQGVRGWPGSLGWSWEWCNVWFFPSCNDRLMLLDMLLSGLSVALHPLFWRAPGASCCCWLIYT